MAKTVKKEKKVPAKGKQLGQVNTDFAKLGKRMRELRVKKGYKSFETFAYDNDMSRVMYGSYEKGSGNITYKNLLKVIKALGVTIPEFFSEGFD
jgi:transcriptional regulator with XRE-family HTH domain